MATADCALLVGFRENDRSIPGERRRLFSDVFEADYFVDLGARGLGHLGQPATPPVNPVSSSHSATPLRSGRSAPTPLR